MEVLLVQRARISSLTNVYMYAYNYIYSFSSVNVPIEIYAETKFKFEGAPPHMVRRPWPEASAGARHRTTRIGVCHDQNTTLQTNRENLNGAEVCKWMPRHTPHQT